MNASLKAFSKTMHTSKHIRPAKVERLARRIIHDVSRYLLIVIITCGFFYLGGFSTTDLA